MHPHELLKQGRPMFKAVRCLGVVSCNSLDALDVQSDVLVAVLACTIPVGCGQTFMTAYAQLSMHMHMQRGPE